MRSSCANQALCGQISSQHAGSSASFVTLVFVNKERRMESSDAPDKECEAVRLVCALLCKNGRGGEAQTAQSNRRHLETKENAPGQDFVTCDI